MSPPPRKRSRRALAAGAAAIAALAATGCAGTGAHSTQVTSAARSGQPRSGATTHSTSTDPTTSSSSTTTSSSSTVSLAGTGRPTVTIGDKNYTEQFVLGQLYLQALRAQGFTVNITQNIGPQAVFTAALKSGTLAMYPEYLDTFTYAIAHRHGRYPTAYAAYAASARWAATHGLTLLSPTPFSDTQAIATTVAYAATYHLRSIVDLRRVGATLVLGGAAQLAKSAPGLPTLSAAYGVTPASFLTLGVGDQYSHLDDGSVQAAYVTSTDGELASGDYALLSDPRHIFGWGNVVPVVSSAALAKEGPAFAETIERVDAMLTRAAIRSMNAAVDLGQQDPAAVAKQFLETHGLLDPLTGSASAPAGAETTSTTG